MFAATRPLSRVRDKTAALIAGSRRDRDNNHDGTGHAPPSRELARGALLLDFTGTAGKHRLIDPADCFAGGGEIWPEDVAAEVNRLMGAAARDVQETLDAAMAACSRRRGELEVEAIVRFHAKAIDVFLGADPNRGRARSLTDRPSGDFARPTENQRAALERAGVTLSRLPPSFSARDASALLGRLAERRAAGLCSLAQAKAIPRPALTREP